MRAREEGGDIEAVDSPDDPEDLLPLIELFPSGLSRSQGNGPTEPEEESDTDTERLCISETPRSASPGKPWFNLKNNNNLIVCLSSR